MDISGVFSDLLVSDFEVVNITQEINKPYQAINAVKRNTPDLNFVNDIFTLRVK